MIADSRKGEIVLPQFQRNFVWSRDDITALLVSILEGHFIGSFLLLRTDHAEAPFAIRAIEGVDLRADQLKPDLMVLDGQQRLTSLHYTFSAPDIPLKWTKYPYQFFLDLKKIENGDFEEAIFSERADRCEGYLREEYQFTNLILPFTAIEDWNTWLNKYERWLIEKNQDRYLNVYFNHEKLVWNDLMERVKHFTVPVIEIPKIPPNDPERIAEVCAIFEKMNSTGVKLSVYDLLTARMYRFGIDMHSLWKKAVNQNELLNQYSDGEPDYYGVYVLRTLSLIRRLDAKSKTLINLDNIEFEEDWNKTINYIEKALERITSSNEDGFGVIDPKWMPYSTMVSPLAAMLHAIESQRMGHNAYKLIQRWYWASVFRERYAGSVESKIYKDFQDFKKAVKDENFEPEVIQEARLNIVENDSFSLREFSRVNSVYRGVMCLIAKRGAKDFQADDAIEFHALDDHHVFPRKYLQNQKNEQGERLIGNGKINSIVNRTLISSQTNRRISKRSPSDYLKNIVPESRANDIMESHFIDQDALQAMRNDDYKAFLDARELALMLEINKRLS
jgi:hypothetical protein